jgi:hypothetical protein
MRKRFHFALILAASTLAACGGGGATTEPTTQERAEALAKDEHSSVLETIRRHPELFILLMCGDTPCGVKPAPTEWGPVDFGYGGTGSTSWESVPVTRKDVSPVDGGAGTQ